MEDCDILIPNNGRNGGVKLVELSILFILIILNAFFAASEIALISLNDNKVKLMADSGNKKAKMLHALLQEPSRFLATIQIGITLAGFLASAFAAESFAGQMAVTLHEIGVPLSEMILETISVVVITLILSYFTLVLGELVPKRLALQKAEVISMFAVIPLTFLSKVSSPFVKLLTLSTNLVVRLFGVDPNAEDEHVTEEEIRMMIDVGQEKGTIQEAEKMMINNVFEFDNKTVSDIMTHRLNIVAIPVELELKEIFHVANFEKYTRFPVFENSIDNIIGILHVKDLIRFSENCDKDAFQLSELIREPYFVLESKRIDHLFKEMQKNNIHMAIAIDEYGGTDGIVTIEDVLEELVGNIFDEYDEPQSSEEGIQKLENGNYVLPGIINLYEVEDFLNVKFPTEEFDTLSGFLINTLGYIPSGKEQIETKYKNMTFIIKEMNAKRITKVEVRLK